MDVNLCNDDTINNLEVYLEEILEKILEKCIWANNCPDVDMIITEKFRILF